MLQRIRARYVVLAIATLGLSALALWGQLTGQADGASDDAIDSGSGEQERLHIESVKPSTLAPGGAVIVRVGGVDEHEAAQLHAELVKRPVDILHRDGSSLVVRIPSDTALGQVKLRVIAGDHHSKPWVLTLRPLPRFGMLRDVLGGLALFILGLRTLASSLRASAGRRGRAAIERLTRGSLRAAPLGVLLGMFTQSTTSAASLVGGLVSARMLPLQAAVALVLSAQLGAAVAGVCLPLLAADEALWLLAIGVLCLSLAQSRLGRSLAMFVVGLGVIFHGLGLLEAGLAPLLNDPVLLPYLTHFKADSVVGSVLCVSVGALLSALLQGPALSIALVTSLAQSSGILDRFDALAILAGTCLGAVVSTVAACWPFGSEARRMALVHAWLSLPMTLLALCGVPLWSRIAPNDLGLGFVLLTAAAVVLGLALLPLGLRALAAPQLTAAPAMQTPRGAATSAHDALLACKRALGALREVARTGDRGPSAEAESALRDASQALQTLVAAEPSPEMPHLRNAGVAGLHLVSAIDHALRVAEKAPEHGFVAPRDATLVMERMHEQLCAGLDEIARRLDAATVPSLLEAQSREIEINAQEAEARRALFEPHNGHDKHDKNGRDNGNGQGQPARLWASELCAAYEAAGNHLYRVAGALGASNDDA